MKYCTMAKSMGRSRPIWTSVVVCARVACAMRPVRSIPVAIFLRSRCAERCANDAFLTSFRATLMIFVLLFTVTIWATGSFPSDTWNFSVWCVCWKWGSCWCTQLSIASTLSDLKKKSRIYESFLHLRIFQRPSLITFLVQPSLGCWPLMHVQHECSLKKKKIIRDSCHILLSAEQDWFVLKLMISRTFSKTASEFPVQRRHYGYVHYCKKEYANTILTSAPNHLVEDEQGSH